MSKKMFFSPIGGGGYLDKLVGYYPFNSNGNDFSGKGHNGIILGAPNFFTGKVGKAIDLLDDISNKYIKIPHTTDFNFSDNTSSYPFSMCMWVKFHAFNNIGNWFINKRTDTSAGDEWELIYFENRLQFYKFQYNNNSIYQITMSSVNPFSLNTWYHIAYTDDGTEAVGSGKLYINGIKNTESNLNNGAYTKLNYGNNLSAIGCSSWEFIYELKHKGLIDETIIIKNHELSPSEITDIYNKGLAGIPLI